MDNLHGIRFPNKLKRPDLKSFGEFIEDQSRLGFSQRLIQDSARIVKASLRDKLLRETRFIKLVENRVFFFCGHLTCCGNRKCKSGDFLFG
ncbi:hypothetical protein SDC9_43586 [bioreactor metagenome]|uniref:Uncharacterized protein n=1 Tax=bioreactor metagenome TaxID=1076179 RepID=A0A644W0Y0_9ZZZZ